MMAETEKPKAVAEKAAPLNYGNSAALAQPKRQEPPAGRATGGGGGRAAEDVITAAKVLLDNRGVWYLVANEVANPGRFYDGFRGQGAQVRVSRVSGKTVKLTDTAGRAKDVPVYDVYAMIPPGEVVAWKKGVGAKGKQTENGETRPPVQSGAPRGGSQPLSVVRGK